MARSRRPVEEIRFRSQDTTEVVRRIQALTEAEDGWVNLQPALDPEHEPPPPGLLSQFLGATVSVPVATWVASHPRRSGTVPAQLGLQHGAGARVLGRLAEGGVVVPDGWVVRQDSPRRGLVLDLVTPGPPERVVSFALAAAERLTPLPLGGEWRAVVYGPRTAGPREP